MEKRDKYLSYLERRRFDILSESMTIKDAANKMGIEPGTLYNWLYKTRKKLERERGHLNAILAQQKRTTLLKEVLSKRRPISPTEYEDEEEIEYGGPKWSQKNVQSKKEWRK
jgi:predicted DNA-binding protein (UPF0251 family)